MMKQFNLKKTKFNRGFTLIELLTVIAIIGLLSTVILTSLSSSRDKANDAKVKLQIKSIVNALNLARDPATGAFPGVSGQWQCLKSSGSCWKNTYTGNSTISDALAPFLSSIPTPPNPPFGPSSYQYDAYLYIPDYPSGGSLGSPGAYLVWGQSMSISSGACDGYNTGAALDDGFYYCYEYLGR